MTSDLYLIAHKVRGALAFDIAMRCECPECIAMGCSECDDLGYWWIIPTSGHRAYPWWSLSLNIKGFEDSEALCLIMDHNPVNLMWTIFEMPPNLPDHYPHRAAPTLSLTQALGLDKPAVPRAPIVRRF